MNTAQTIQYTRDQQAYLEILKRLYLLLSTEKGVNMIERENVLFSSEEHRKPILDGLAEAIAETPEQKVSVTEHKILQELSKMKDGRYFNKKELPEDVIESMKIISRKPRFLKLFNGDSWQDIHDERVSMAMKRKVEHMLWEPQDRLFQERHLIIPDPHVPDQNVQAMRTIYKFMESFDADYIHLLGDVINMTKLFRYAQIPSERDRQVVSVAEELDAARSFLCNITDKARKVNPKVEILFYEGNHEERLLKYLYRRGGEEYAPLKVDGEYVLSIPHLLELNKLNIRWLPKDEFFEIAGKFRLLHGDIVRKHAGYAAKEMMDQTGTSGAQGHTHRLGIHCHTYNGESQMWMELGCLQNIPPDPPYISKHRCNWQTGFGVAIYHEKTEQIYAVPILMQDHKTFIFGSKLFTPE